MEEHEGKVFYSYLLDVVSLAVFISFSFGLEHLSPTLQNPDLSDKSIGFPFVKYETISPFMLPLFNMVIPTVIILFTMAINRFKNKKLLVAFLGLYLSVALSFLLTNIFKAPIGRLRPDFIDRCFPGGIPKDIDLSKPVRCSGVLKVINEGRKSFPSGHTSSSFGGLGFAALFLAGQLHTFDGSAYIYRFIVFVLPYLTAALIGITRIVDHRHHWDDVLVGGIIGFSASIIAYFYFFPSLHDPNSHLPRNIRFISSSSERLEDSVPCQQEDSKNLPPV